jgi:hypothetical protein
MNLLGNENQLSEIKNPFTSDKIEKIVFTICNYEFMKEPEYEAKINFNIGSTSFKHEVKADNFVNLVAKVEQIIKNHK